MWELIQSNRRKSILLFFCMGIILFALGYIVGNNFFEGGGLYGIIIAILIWIILSIVSVYFGSSIILSISGAKEITKDSLPQLYNVVEEMKIAANLKTMPKIYVVNSEAPNAFAAGKNPDNSAVAVTAGLLSKLNRNELQGVIGHEISHILNRDTKFLTYAAIMLGTIVIVSEIFLRGMWFSGSSRRYSSKSSKGAGQIQFILLIVSILFAVLAPIMARLFYLAISRKREYLADASAVRLTRYPEGLASALEKLSESRNTLSSANKITAAMYIVNPLKKRGMKLSDLTSTHPPISERIKILRNMMHGANYIDYQKAYSFVKRTVKPVIPKSGLRDNTFLALRSLETDTKEKLSKISERRKAGDIMMKVNDYSFLTCDCGLKIKIPPAFGMNKPEVKCPKCGKIHLIKPLPRQRRASLILPFSKGEEMNPSLW